MNNHVHAGFICEGNIKKVGSRDDKIRTCDHAPPRRVLYRAELHPAF